MVGRYDTRKGATRCYQEGFQWNCKLVEEVVASVSEDNTGAGDCKTAQTAENTAFERGTGEAVSFNFVPTIDRMSKVKVLCASDYVTESIRVFK